MRRETLLSLVCAVAFLLTAVPTSGPAAPAQPSALPLGALPPTTGAAPHPIRLGGLPAGWTYWNQTIDWRNYSLRYFPGTRQFFPGVNMFDALVVSNQIPDGQMTAYYVNGSGQLLSYDLQTGVYRTLGAWPTNLSSYDSPSMVQGFQGWNGSLTALYEIGSNGQGYVDVEWYSLANGTFDWANTTIEEGTSATNVNYGVFNATGWVFYTNNAESTVDLFNVFSHTLVTASAPAMPAWNSATYVAGADQVVEDVDQTSNGTLEVRAFNATFSRGAPPTIHIVTRWGGSTSGVDFENMPYFFNVSGPRTTLWGLGGGGDPNRNMVVSLSKDLELDGDPSTTDTGTLGTSDTTEYAFWDDSHYFFNGYNPTVGAANQAPYIDPLNDSGIFASGGANATWFNAFLSTYNFGFGGGPWVNTWQFIGPAAGWVNALVDNGTSSGTSCGSICTLLLYWLPARTTEFANPPLPVGSVTGTALSSSAIEWSWSQSPSPGILNDTLDLYAGSNCTSRVATASAGGPVTNYTSTGLQPATAYSSAVIAWNASGASPVSGCAAATTLPTPPGAPTMLAVAGETLTSLRWTWTNPAPSSSFTNISLAYGTSAGTLTTVVSEGPVDTATTTGLRSGTSYYAQVTAWNDTIPSLGSEEANGTTLFVAPPPPTGLRQTANTSTTLSVAWTDPPPGTFTNITLDYRALDSAIETSISEGTTAIASISGLTAASAYVLAVEAWNGTAPSARSPDLELWTRNPAPSAPASLIATAESTTSISWAWTNPASGSFDNISLQYGLRAGSLPTVVSIGVVRDYTLTGLGPATAYYAEVVAWNQTVASGPSEEVQAQTARALPAAPSGLHVTSVGPTSIALAWTLPDGGFTNVSLEYHPESVGVANRTLSLGGRLSATTVGSLLPDTSYAFSVATWNLTSGSGYVPFLNATTASNSSGPGAACSTLCAPALLVVGAAAIGAVLIALGAVVLARRQRRPPP